MLNQRPFICLLACLSVWNKKAVSIGPKEEIFAYSNAEIRERGRNDMQTIGRDDDIVVVIQLVLTLRYSIQESKYV